MLRTLTLNNPPLNLVTLEMTERLIEALDELEGDASVRAVVVTGAGEKAFCAGSMSRSSRTSATGRGEEAGQGERGLREARVPVQA